MCFTIVGKRTKVHAKFKTRRIAYKVVRRLVLPRYPADLRTFANEFVHRGNAEYVIGKESAMRGLSPEHPATKSQHLRNGSGAGFYVYSTYEQARRFARLGCLAVIAVKVKPSDLLHVSKGGTIATYRALTPIRSYNRNGSIQHRA